MSAASEEIALTSTKTKSNKKIESNAKNCDPKYSLRPILDLKSNPLAK